MSRRESNAIAVAGGLNAKGLDITKYRQRWIGDKRPDLRADEAGGALGFAAGPVFIEDEHGIGEWFQGDEFRGTLLRLKMGRQLSPDAFKRAVLLLLKRHAEPDPSTTEESVAAGALFEWLSDPCTVCRTAKAGESRPKPCPACFPIDRDGEPVPRRDLIEFFSHAKRRVIACFASVPGAKNGCMKCDGMGRVFGEHKKRRSMSRCKACKNTGRIEFEASQRWRFVNDYLRMHQVARGESPIGINRRAFLKGWMTRYDRFLKHLQAHERKLGVGLDLGLNASKMARTGSMPDGD